MRGSERMVVRAETFEGCAVQFFLVVWVGNADQESCTFLERFAVKVDSSEFCHNVVDVRSCCYDSAAFSDNR